MEKTYLFNPFDIKNWENLKIKNELDELIDRYLKDDSSLSLYQHSLNIENLANQNYLLGEMIARLTEDTLLLKNKVENAHSLQTYKERNTWTKMNEGKAPAMSYFEAIADEFVSEDRERLAKLQSDLKRFQIAYKSMEEKINANKKKMEAIKVEEFNR